MLSTSAHKEPSRNKMKPLALTERAGAACLDGGGAPMLFAAFGVGGGVCDEVDEAPDDLDEDDAVARK